MKRRLQLWREKTPLEAVCTSTVDPAGESRSEISISIDRDDRNNSGGGTVTDHYIEERQK